MKKTIIALAVSMVLAFSAFDAFACSCAGITQKKEFERSEQVFVGQFVKHTENGARFKISRSWKGLKAGNIIELSYFDLDGCNRDFTFTEGKKYLIYGVRASDDRKLFISLDCGRSNPVEWASEDLKNMAKIARRQKT